jgi:hypothetical protein
MSKIQSQFTINLQKAHRLIPPGQLIWFMLLLPFALAACDNMANQPRHDPLDASAFFPDGRSARPLVPGTVPRGSLDEAPEFYSGRDAEGMLLDEMPIEVTLEVLERGRERYDIYCAPCHGFDGYGEGIIVQRGFPAPQSFHTDRLRAAPDGHYFDVITNGFGRMYDYSYRVNPSDRWAITSYIRALQLSQFATEEDVPPGQVPELEGNTP